MPRRAKKLPVRVWRVVCVLGDGQRTGDCGHGHRSSMAAVRCPYDEPRAYKRDFRAGLFVVEVVLNRRVETL